MKLRPSPQTVDVNGVTRQQLLGNLLLNVVDDHLEETGGDQTVIAEMLPEFLGVYDAVDVLAHVVGLSVLAVLLWRRMNAEVNG